MEVPGKALQGADTRRVRKNGRVHKGTSKVNDYGEPLRIEPAETQYIGDSAANQEAWHKLMQLLQEAKPDILRRGFDGELSITCKVSNGTIQTQFVERIRRC